MPSLLCLFFLMIFECDFSEQTSSTEPHSPLVILERGRLSFSQYEQQISSRRDFIRCTRKDSEPERKVGSFSHCFSTSTFDISHMSQVHMLMLHLVRSWSL